MHTRVLYNLCIAVACVVTDEGYDGWDLANAGTTECLDFIS